MTKSVSCKFHHQYVFTDMNFLYFYIFFGIYYIFIFFFGIFYIFIFFLVFFIYYNISSSEKEQLISRCSSLDFDHKYG